MSPELKVRAVRPVGGHVGQCPSLTAASAAVAKQLGFGKEPVRRWVVRAQVDGGQRPGLSGATLTTPFQLGLVGQVAGLVTFQLSYPVVIVRARLLTIGTQYEQSAVDLGASPLQAVRRVLLPMLVPVSYTHLTLPTIYSV